MDAVLNARVVQLTRYIAKNSPGEALPEAKLIEGLGMEGDMHQGGERQLSLLSDEIRRWMEAQPQKGLCFKKFRENILIEGLTLEELPDGCLLSAGEAVLRVSVKSKRCFDECARFSAGMPCRLSSGAVFAVVARGGSVRTGDSLSILPDAAL